SVRDSHHKEVFVQLQIPAPDKSVTIKLQGDPDRLLRRAAIDALVSIAGKEKEVFADLAGLIKKDVERDAAIRGIQRLPKAKWPSEQFGDLAKHLLVVVEKAPKAERAEPAILDVVQLGTDLAGLMGPGGQSLAKDFAQYQVQVVRIGTIPH